MLTSYRCNSFPWMRERIKLSTGRFDIQHVRCGKANPFLHKSRKMFAPIFGSWSFWVMPSLIQSPLLLSCQPHLRFWFTTAVAENVIHTSFFFSQLFKIACKMSFENGCYIPVLAVIQGHVTYFNKINKQTNKTPPTLS